MNPSTSDNKSEDEDDDFDFDSFILQKTNTDHLKGQSSSSSLNSKSIQKHKEEEHVSSTSIIDGFGFLDGNIDDDEDFDVDDFIRQHKDKDIASISPQIKNSKLDGVALDSEAKEYFESIPFIQNIGFTDAKYEYVNDEVLKSNTKKTKNINLEKIDNNDNIDENLEDEFVSNSQAAKYTNRKTENNLKEQFSDIFGNDSEHENKKKIKRPLNQIKSDDTLIFFRDDYSSTLSDTFFEISPEDVKINKNINEKESHEKKTYHSKSITSKKKRNSIFSESDEDSDEVEKDKQDKISKSLEENREMDSGTFTGVKEDDLQRDTANGESLRGSLSMDKEKFDKELGRYSKRASSLLSPLEPDESKKDSSSIFNLASLRNSLSANDRDTLKIDSTAPLQDEYPSKKEKVKEGLDLLSQMDDVIKNKDYRDFDKRIEMGLNTIEKLKENLHSYLEEKQQEEKVRLETGKKEFIDFFGISENQFKQRVSKLKNDPIFTQMLGELRVENSTENIQTRLCGINPIRALSIRVLMVESYTKLINSGGQVKAKRASIFYSSTGPEKLRQNHILSHFGENQYIHHNPIICLWISDIATGFEWQKDITVTALHQFDIKMSVKRPFPFMQRKGQYFVESEQLQKLERYLRFYANFVQYQDKKYDAVVRQLQGLVGLNLDRYLEICSRSPQLNLIQKEWKICNEIETTVRAKQRVIELKRLEMEDMRRRKGVLAEHLFDDKKSVEEKISEILKPRNEEIGEILKPSSALLKSRAANIFESSEANAPPIFPLKSILRAVQVEYVQLEIEQAIWSKDFQSKMKASFKRSLNEIVDSFNNLNIAVILIEDNYDFLYEMNRWINSIVNLFMESRSSNFTGTFNFLLQYKENFAPSNGDAMPDEEEIKIIEREFVCRQIEAEVVVPCWNKISQYLRVKGRHFRLKSDEHLRVIFQESIQQYKGRDQDLDYSDSDDDAPSSAHTWFSSEEDSIQRFSDKIKRIVRLNLSQRDFYINPSIRSPSNWVKAVSSLSRLGESSTLLPCNLLDILVETTEIIYSIYREEQEIKQDLKGNPKPKKIENLGADDFLPIFMYVCIEACRLSCVKRHSKSGGRNIIFNENDDMYKLDGKRLWMIRELLTSFCNFEHHPYRMTSSMMGYCVTTLEACLSYFENLDENGEKQLKNDDETQHNPEIKREELDHSGTFSSSSSIDVHISTTIMSNGFIEDRERSATNDSETPKIFTTTKTVGR